MRSASAERQLDEQSTWSCTAKAGRLNLSDRTPGPQSLTDWLSFAVGRLWRRWRAKRPPWPLISPGRRDGP